MEPVTTAAPPADRGIGDAAHSAGEGRTPPPIEAYLHDLASGSPVPGGGSAAAMTGALAAALVAMVARLTVGKPSFAAVDAEARRLVDRSDAARHRLATAMADDERAFAAVMDGYRLPRDTAEARARRRDAIAAAARAATVPPLEVAHAARDVLDLASEAARIGNPAVVSDAAVAAWAAHAAIRASAVNVRANFAGARDAEFARGCELELARLVEDAARLASAIEAAVAARS